MNIKVGLFHDKFESHSFLLELLTEMKWHNTLSNKLYLTIIIMQILIFSINLRPCLGRA